MTLHSPEEVSNLHKSQNQINIPEKVSTPI